MNALFLTSLFPGELKAEIKKNSVGAIANANDSLQWSFLEGFSNHCKDFDVLNAPNIGAYPLKYKKIKLRFTNFNIPSDFSGKSVGFFNLVGIKHISRYFNIKKELFRWINHIDSEKIIIIYDLYPPFLKAAYALKKKYPELKVCLIVPDLQEFTGTPDNVLYRIFGMFGRKVLTDSLSCVDSYVLLSKHMKSHLPINNKPFTVIEGIYNPQIENSQKRNTEKGDNKTIFYSGAIDERNGILRLISAFQEIDRANYRLIICGDGPCKNQVLEAAKKDIRISYLGQINREEVVNIQQSSTLLINPRTPEGEFTKYSFPSKTMEYFASGVPTLMYVLEGVPEEYYNYCYYLVDTSIEKLAKEIVSICEQNLEILIEKGEKARKFVLENKNPKIQVGKMVRMLENQDNIV